MSFGRFPRLLVAAGLAAAVSAPALAQVSYAGETDPQAAAEAIGRQLNLTADEVLAQMADYIYLDATEQAGADYLGTPDAPGALAENLLSAAEFLKAQGQVDEVPALSVFQAGLANSFAEKVAAK